ncbi:MAG: hypothetical protein HY815_14265 [Candidatus Riflebacteria bacterium]|nr:hypothetical protein [Candidatus Riflebacteria bacterium]
MTRLSPATAYRRLVRSGRPWALVQIVIVLVFSTLAAADFRSINHDCALLLQAAQLVLEGHRPYVDLFETNPPWIIFLNVPIAWVSRALGLSAALTFVLAVQLLFAAGALALSHVLGRLARRLDQAEAGTLILGFILANGLIAIRGELGQREHLFFLALVPYAFLRLLRHQGGACHRWVAGSIGLALGLTVLVKPHFFIGPILLEIVLVVAHGRRPAPGRPEWIAALAPMGAYALYWLTLPPPVWRAFTDHAAFMLGGYGAYAKGLGRIVESLVTYDGYTAVALVLTVTWIALVARMRFVLRPIVLVLLAVTVSGLAILLIQSRNYGYHRAPFYGGAAMLLAASLVVARSQSRNRRGLGWLRCDMVLVPFGLAVGTAALSLGLVVPAVLRPGPDSPLERIVKRWSRPGDTVFFIDTSVTPAYPLLLLLDRKPGTRTFYCYPLALIGKLSGRWSDEDSPRPPDPGALIARELRYLAELEEDLRRSRPAMVLIRKPPCQACPAGFDVRDYLRVVGVMSRAVTPLFDRVEDHPLFWVYVRCRICERRPLVPHLHLETVEALLKSLIDAPRKDERCATTSPRTF